MKIGYTGPLLYVLLCIALTGWICSAYGDGECDPVKELTASFEKGASAEKAGKLADAFSHYNKARYDYSCEGKNPVSGEAKAGWKRTGKKLSDEEEKKGNLYRRGDQNKTAGAFQWLEASENFAEADRVMMKMMRAKPEDIDTFAVAFEHFNNRKEQSADLIKEHGYSLDHSYYKEVAMAAAKNGERALEREDKDINKNVIDLGGSPVDHSIARLETARKWFDFFKDAKEAKVVERAVKRGDALYADDNGPQSLEDAIRYYKFVNDQDKIKKVKDKAAKLAVAAEKENVLIRAVHYYKIADNSAKAEQLEKNLEERSKKQQKEMLKDDSQKKKFKAV
ncbi:MAG: hypothetical protein HY808_11550 [Nitrospirae bacterium]|nr:hypothetical protein [Nitrospirota bacterium]